MPFSPADFRSLKSEIFSYEALDVNFTGIEPKIPAALILPEEFQKRATE